MSTVKQRAETWILDNVLGGTVEVDPDGLASLLEVERKRAIEDVAEWLGEQSFECLVDDVRSRFLFREAP